MQAKLRTHYGELEIEARLFQGMDKRILVAQQEHGLLIRGKIVRAPPGVFYVENKDLARHRNETHMFVPQGLYHLLRMVMHVANSSQTEQLKLSLTLQDLRLCARFILRSGCMTLEEKHRIHVVLNQLEADLQQVRNDRKDVGRQRIQKSRELFASPDRRKIAPASLVLYAGGHHLSERFKDLTSISSFFSVRSVVVHAHICALMRSVVDLSRFLEEGKPGAPTMRLTGLFPMLTRRKEEPKILQDLVRQLAAYRDEFVRMDEQPFQGLALLATWKLDAMSSALEDKDDTALAAHATELSRVLRRMRMIDHVEMNVIAILSFYLRRTPEGQHQESDPELRAFSKRFQDAFKRIRAFKPEECEPSLKKRLLVLFEKSSHTFLSGRYTLTKDTLKKATQLLADIKA